MFKSRIFKEKIIKSTTNVDVKQFLMFQYLQYLLKNVNVFNLIKKIYFRYSLK